MEEEYERLVKFFWSLQPVYVIPLQQTLARDRSLALVILVFTELWQKGLLAPNAPVEGSHRRHDDAYEGLPRVSAESGHCALADSILGAGRRGGTLR